MTTREWPQQWVGLHSHLKNVQRYCRNKLSLSPVTTCLECYPSNVTLPSGITLPRLLLGPSSTSSQGAVSFLLAIKESHWSLIWSLPGLVSTPQELVSNAVSAGTWEMRMDQNECKMMLVSIIAYHELSQAKIASLWCLRLGGQVITSFQACLLCTFLD